MLWSTSCYTYSTSLGRGGGENHPHHEGVSYPMRPVQWQTDGQDKRMTTLLHKAKKHPDWQTEEHSSEEGSSSTGMRLHSKYELKHMVASECCVWNNIAALHSPLTLHLATAWTASSWNLDYSSISWYLEIQEEDFFFFFYWCSVTASDEPLWSAWFFELTTVSWRDRFIQRLLAQSFCGDEQFLPQFADVTVSLCFHDAELRIDVFIFVCGIFLVLYAQNKLKSKFYSLIHLSHRYNVYP